MRAWIAERVAPVLGGEQCFRIGKDLCNRGEFGRGARFLGRAARNGHAAAQLRMAQLYLRGQGVPPSTADAARWLRRAAEADFPPAQQAYAALLWSGTLNLDSDGIFGRAPRPDAASDVAAALHWAERAAAAGLAEAQALLGEMLCFGPQAVRDTARGEGLFAQAAAAGQPQGSLGLALLMHRRAETAPEAAEEARRLFGCAAESGSAYASFALGVMAERTAAQDPAAWREAAGHYERAAKGGHRGAQARWGMFLVEGLGAPRRTVEGESWVRKAALAGERDAAAWLGDHYAEAQGPLPPNLLEAAAWYRRAAEMGHGAAARRLGLIYCDGRVGHDVLEAAALFCQAAQLGETEALMDLQQLIDRHALPQAAMAEAIKDLPAGQYWYGRWLLDRAVATGADPSEARGWLTRAAEGGVVAAQAVLGEMMLHGRGGARDLPGALRLFETAAAQDHLGAIFALGVLFAGAPGVQRDLARSEALLGMAAERGHEPARAELARFRATGVYGPPHQGPSGMLQNG